MIRRICSAFLASVILLTSCYLADKGESKKNTEGDLSKAKGIKLDIRNPYGRIKYCAGYIYVSGASQLFPMNDGTVINEWGGVQRIDVNSYETGQVIFKGRRISDVAVISSTRAYVIEYIDWGNSALRRFNPETGEVYPGNVAGIGDTGNINLISMEADKNNRLWVCCSTYNNSGIIIVNTDSDTIEGEKIDTGLAPQYLRFCSDKAVVVTATVNYSSGAHAVVPIEEPRTPVVNLTADTSDLAIDVFGNHFYRIQRYMSDSVMKFHIDHPGRVRPDINTKDPDVIWQYSAIDSDDIDIEGLSSTNPHSLVVYSETKGFLLRYESRYAWIVNPSAAGEDSFKTGVIDLSVYADKDGIPEMTSGVIVGNRLFIAMQRLYRDRDNIWKTNSPSCIAVFNADTCEEIDTRNP